MAEVAHHATCATMQCGMRHMSVLKGRNHGVTWWQNVTKSATVLPGVYENWRVISLYQIALQIWLESARSSSLGNALPVHVLLDHEQRAERSSCFYSSLFLCFRLRTMPKRSAHERVQPAVAASDAEHAHHDFPEQMLVEEDSSDTGEDLDSQSESEEEGLGTGLTGTPS